MIATSVAQDETQSREELILRHLPQVRMIAGRIHRGVPTSVPIDDLVSAGIVGLIAAIDRYSSLHGVKLRTYAEHKIRGAILDSLRVLDWAPRQQRRRAKLIQSAVHALEQTLGRAPTEEEVAEELGLSVAQYHDWKAETNSMTVTSLDYGDCEKETGSLLQFIFDSEDQRPAQLLEQSELYELLRSAVSQLPRTEQTILTLYFVEDLTLREIAQIISVHESRISQLKRQALLRLRTQMRASWPTRGSIAAELPARAA